MGSSWPRTASIRRPSGGPADLARLPLLTKANYVQRYPLAELVAGGRLESCDTMALSSGSTGAATFWPRFVTDELAVAMRFEQVFQDSFAAHERRTLAVVCFALGSWVGGLFTSACCRHLAAKGYPLVTVAPGINKPEIYRILTELGPAFDQVVLLGYPPYLKDVVDGGPAAGVDWAKLKTRLVTAGEVFSEEWRSLVGERLGSTNPRYDIASLYGTADAGVLANETPLSIHIRRFLADHPEIGRELFGEARLPTLAQYDPYHRYFEAVDGTLIFSGDTGLPLLRYHIADSGGLIGYDEMLRFLARHGFDPRAGLAGQGWRGVRRLPFVYVFGRANFAVSSSAPTSIPRTSPSGWSRPRSRPGPPASSCSWSGRGWARRPRSMSRWSWRPASPPMPRRSGGSPIRILAQLLRLNSEFANYTPADYRRPVVELMPAGDPGWFPVGVKHRYSRPREPSIRRRRISSAFSAGAGPELPQESSGIAAILCRLRLMAAVVSAVQATTCRRDTDAMTADSPFHSARLAAALSLARRSSLPAGQPRRRLSTRARGVATLLLLLTAAAVLLSLAVMFLPLSHPPIPEAPPHGYSRPHMHPSLIPSLG